MSDELCDSCKKFDEVMNGGPASLDIFVVCDHQKNEVEIRKVAEADGKCFKCGNHCMECGCWLEGIIDPIKDPEKFKEWLELKKKIKWISWEDHPIPDDVQGILIKYDDGVYCDRHDENGKRYFREGHSVIGWNFVQRRDPNRKTVQPIMRKTHK